MDNSKKRRKKARESRLMRVRKRVQGSSERPRLSISKTNQHLYAQLINDETGETLFGFGSLSKEAKFKRKSKESAKEVGQKIALMAVEKQIERVVFDRGRYKFHGLIAELAKSAREAGLQF